MTTLLKRLALLLLASLTLMFASAARADEATFLSDRLSVEVVGSGPDVILIPGLASSREVWRPLANGLSAHYRVHLVQLAGFAGEPWWHADEPFLQPVVEELDRYIQQNGLRAPAIIGHSLGGLCALMLAQAHAQDVGRVMTVETLPFYSALLYPGTTVEQARPLAEQAAAEILALDDNTYRDRQTLVAQGMTRDVGMQQQIVQWSLASDRHAVATALREAMLTDVREALPHMTTPVTAVYTDAGRPADQVDELWSQGYRGLPGVKRVRIANALHFIMSDRPEAFARLVDGFLRD
ncbi:alpha/beta hydrolase [Pseudomonas sp. HR96]|uniref:alpha/beta fold hydrolase n=1 Tax=Pseudomonas sp. HR96 TaxID=1027966 RepID=UPI002A762608|nr:alpha/beta hydrolase [Pseudomonas sp. HR96]WPO97662.1 alpha/beta hydrolase [Pseudomonas sp. HR96]